MTNGLVFILHGSTEAAFAAALAEALSPLVAMPMAVTAGRQTAYGSGATCLVLLDGDLAGRPEDVVSSASIANTIICRGNGVAAPDQLASYSFVDVQATVEATASVLRDAIAKKQRQSAERATRSRRAAPSLAKQGSELRETARHSTLVRSALGLAATIAVASIAAPAIGGRAGASSVTPEGGATNLASSESAAPQIVVTPDSAPSVDEQEHQSVESPSLVALLDHLDRTAPAATVVAHATDEAPLVLDQAVSVEALAIPSVSSDSHAMLFAASVGAPKQATAPVAVEPVQALQTSSAAAKPSA